nr:MFS transporter [Candidatus Sigynarchaeota archaeon]
MSTSEKLKRGTMFAYTLGAIPVALFGGIFGLKYIEFFYDDLQLLPAYFIAGQVIYMIVNALNDPLSGQLSDTTNPKKWGSRRIIYIKWGAPIWALTFLLLWFPWSFTDQLVIFLHYVISLCLFDTMLTIVVLVWMALLPEMTIDHDERNKANFYLLVVGVITALPFILILADMSPASEPFRYILIVVSVISTVCLLVVAKVCKERPELYSGISYPFLKSVKESLKSRSFLVYLGYSFFNLLAGSFGLSYLFLFILLTGEAGVMYYILFGLIIGYVSNLWALKLHEKKMWDMRTITLRFSLIRLAITATFLPFILFTNEVAFIYLALFLTSLFSGCGVFSTPLMYLSMDEDEIKHDTRREGMFLGINALFTKPANSIGPIVATLVLGAFGYIQDSPTQPDSVFFGIKILFFAIPAVFTAASLFFMWIYPLHGELLQTMKKQLEQKHRDRQAKASTGISRDIPVRD